MTRRHFCKRSFMSRRRAINRLPITAMQVRIAAIGDFFTAYCRRGPGPYQRGEMTIDHWALVREHAH